VSLQLAGGLNLHHDAEIEALADKLADDAEEGPCALIVAGEQGEGRRYFAARAVENVRERGLAVLYAAIDLDGYEPERPDPMAYARHAAAKRSASLDPLDEGWIRRSMRGPRPSIHDFLAAALLAGRDPASANMRDRLTEAFSATDPWTGLAESLSPEERFVVHVADTAELPSVVRELLLDLSARFPRFKTVISSLPDDGVGKLVRGRSSLRFEVMPLDEGELRSLVEERLGEPGLPADFHDELWKEGAGVRGVTAAAIERRIQVGQARRDGPQGGSLAPAELIARAASGVEPDQAKLLASFVSLAALCGDNVPVRELLTYLGVEAAELDDWIDRLDETVGPDSENPLFAERFQHPSLPGRTVYGFADRSFPLRLRRDFSPESRGRLAVELMRFLGPRFTVSSRATARFYVELSRWAQAGEQRLELERELAWWVGPDELERTSAILMAELQAGQRTPLAVWTTVNTVQFGWPPERTLALLHAIAGDALPAQLRAPYAAVTASVLLEANRREEAIQVAEAGLQQPNQDRLLESVLWERIGRAHLALERVEEAKEPLARAGKLQEQMLEEGDPRVAPWIEGYARRLREAGREQEAARLEEKLARLQKA
jgi:hypothetical protein